MCSLLLSTCKVRYNQLILQTFANWYYVPTPQLKDNAGPDHKGFAIKNTVLYYT